MSIEKTIERLATLIDNQENKVIALSGKWGTGKSHLWDTLYKNSSNPKVKNSLKISLFGISDLSQIKLRILQSSIPTKSEADKNKIFKSAIATLKSLKLALKAYSPYFNALDEIAILAVPNLLKKRIIVLDDIERKHQNLSIDEVLGFIDEYTQGYDTRFILILNNDKLDNIKLWELLREKVIDHEIHLNTTPEEAYNIASINLQSPFEQQIKKATSTCNITNIRIIKKIINNINFLLGSHEQLPETILKKIIPSTVLLSAIYYKGIEENPTLDQVTAYGKNTNWEDYIEKNTLPTSWEKIMSELGIRYTDRYEDLVVSYLKSGLLDSSEISHELEKYILDDNTLLASHNAHQLIHETLWNQHITEQNIIIEAKKIIPQIKFMNAVTVTRLSTNINEITNGSAVAELFISTWISEIGEQELINYDIDDPLDRDIHIDIQKAIIKAQQASPQKQSVFDICMDIAAEKTWSPQQAKTLNNTTISQYHDILTSLSSNDLKNFTRQMIKMHKDKNHKNPNITTNSFITACSNIIKTKNPERLSTILSRLFELHAIPF